MTRSLALTFLAVLCAGCLWLYSRSDEPNHVGLSRPAAPDPVPGSLEPADREGGRAVVSAAERDVPDDVLHTVRVVTLDPEGESLAGVALHLRSQDTLTPLGTTDPDGRAAVDSGTDGPLTLVATRDGFARTSFKLHPPLPEEARLVLRRAASIRGEVVMPEGGSVGAGVSVVAVPARLQYTTELGALERLAVDPELVFTLTDDAGRFELGELDPLEGYSLVAGGRGLLQARSRKRHLPKDEPVRLVVHEGFAALVSFLEPGGAPARLSGAVGSRGEIRGVLKDPDAFYVQGAPLSMQLAFHFPDAKSLPPHQYLYVVGAKVSGKTEAGPIEVSTHPPGYDPIAVQVMLDRLTDGLADRPVVLHKSAAGFGSLVVAFEPPVVGSRRMGPLGILSLRDATGVAQHPIRVASDAPIVLEPIPYGRYEVRFETRPRTWVHPPEASLLEVEIGPEPARFVVPTKDAPTLEIEVEHADGRPYTSELGILIGNGEAAPGESTGMSGGFVNFLEAPYVLPFIDAGPHAVHLRRPVGGGGWTPVEVAASGTSRVVLRLER